MIIYNVTINVEESIHEHWLNYMKDEHIPDVMKTGCFVAFTFSKIITRQDDETGVTYSIQYKCKNMADYDTYIEKFAPELRKDIGDRYEGKFYAFRTLLEEVE